MKISGRPRRIMCIVVGVTFRYDVDDRYCSNADKEGNTHKGRGGEREARDWNQYSFVELGFQRHGHARNYARESRDAIDTRSSFGHICCFRKNELTEIVFLLFLLKRIVRTLASANVNSRNRFCVLLTSSNFNSDLSYLFEDAIEKREMQKV